MNNTLKNLYSAVADKKAAPTEGSYTSYLFERGLDKILKKIGEECTETILAAKNGSEVETVYEVSDLFYHLIVLMVEKGIPLENVVAELERRAEKISACEPNRQATTSK